MKAAFAVDKVKYYYIPKEKVIVLSRDGKYPVSAGNFPLFG